MPKAERSRQSHAIALNIRDRVTDLPKPLGTVVRKVEVPPGPRVLATLLAEIYGPDEATRRATASKVREVFPRMDLIADTDNTFHPPGDRLRLSINEENLEFYGVEEEAVYDTIAAIIGGVRSAIRSAVTAPSRSRSTSSCRSGGSGWTSAFSRRRRHRPTGRQCGAWRHRHSQA